MKIASNSYKGRNPIRRRPLGQRRGNQNGPRKRPPGALVNASRILHDTGVGIEERYYLFSLVDAVGCPMLGCAVEKDNAYPPYTSIPSSLLIPHPQAISTHSHNSRRRNFLHEKAAQCKLPVTYKPWLALPPKPRATHTTYHNPSCGH